VTDGAAQAGVTIDNKVDCTMQKRQAFLFAAATVLLMLWGLGARGLWAAEGRWAEVVREMRLTRDFFHPTIGGEPYFDKPLLTYWFRVVISAVTGVLNEFTVRLPSALAGIVALWATVRLGTRLWSARTGRLAGWFLLTTYAFLFWSRTGTADAENMAFTMVAVAWYWSRRDRPTFLAMLVFYLIVFVGAQTKGLTAIAVPIVVVLPDIVAERRWRLLLRPGHLLALGIGLLVYLSPFVYASFTQASDYQSSGLGLVFQENILRYFSPLDHKGPFYLYAYELPVLLLPWTPLFVLVAIGVARCRRSLDHHTRWLVWAIVLVFLFFTLSGSRRSYYILPILPFCALLMAVFVAWVHQEGTEKWHRRGLNIQRIVFVGLIAFELAIPLVLTISRRMIGFKVPLGFYVASLVIGVSAALVGSLLRRLSRGSGSPAGAAEAVWPLVGVAVVLLAGYFCWQQNILEVNRTERPFARRLQARVSGSSLRPAGVFPKCNANILFYLDTQGPVQVLTGPDQLRRFMDQTCPGVVITQQRYTAAIPADIAADLQRQKTLHEDVRPWESRSSRKEKWVAWFWESSPAIAAMAKAKEGANDAK